MNIQLSKSTNALGVLGLVLQHAPAGDQRFTHQKAQAHKANKQQPPMPEIGPTTIEMIANDLKKLPLEDLLDVLSYVRELKHQSDAQQGG